MENENLQKSPDTLTSVEYQLEDNKKHQCTIAQCCQFNGKVCKSITVPILLGQLLAGLIAVTAACSGLLANNDISLPLSQNLPHYFFLFLCYGTFKVCRHLRPMKLTDQPDLKSASPTPDNTDNFVRSRMRSRLKHYGLYIVTGIIDVHANWAMVSAYAYTSVTSIQLLDCITIPTAMVLSCLILRHKYSWTHYLATVICLAAAAGMVAVDQASASGSDNSTDDTNNTTIPSNPVLGDVLVILGSLAYAVSNVLQQYMVSKYGFVDFIIYAGGTAFLTTFLYGIALERQGIRELFLARRGASIFGYFSGYFVAMFALYSIMPYALATSGAVLVNLSLLTADVYALLMGIYLFRQHFNLLYLVCFSFILFGVALFSVRKPQFRDHRFTCCLECPGCDHREQDEEDNVKEPGSTQATSLNSEYRQSGSTSLHENGMNAKTNELGTQC